MATELGKVFVVDDEVELATALSDILGQQGYKVEAFASGEDALKALEGQEVDVLLSDIMMPGISGIELLKAARKIDSNLVTIMMTGHGTIETAVEAMKSGAFDYVLKPFKLADLIPVLSRAMEVRRLRLENVQLRESLAIYELTKALAFTLDINTVLNKVAEAAVQQCDADESSIMLLAPEDDYLYVAAIGGKNRRWVLGERTGIGEGIAGWVALHREPVLTNEKIEAAWRSLVKPYEGLLAGISVPMLAGGKVLGVLNVKDTHRPRPFTLGKVKALSILAGIAATALEAAELFARVKQAEGKYRALVEQLPAITYVVSLANGYHPLYISPQVADVIGIPAGKWIGNPSIWEAHIHDDDRGRVLAEMEKCRSGNCRFVSEYRMVTADKRTVWLHDEALPLSYGEGREVVLQGVMVDVTQIQEASQALRASEALNRLLIEESPIGVGMTRDDTYIYANPALTKMFGYEAPDEIIGRHREELIVPEEREMIRRRKKDREEGKPVAPYIELHGLRKNGERFAFDVWPKSIQYLGEPVRLFFAMDTTEARSLRAQLFQSQKMEAVGTLAGGVAHDFNNILTVVSGFSELLLSGKVSDDPEYRDLEKVATAARRGAELVKRLLTFSRKAEAYPHPLNLNTEIEEMKKLLSRAIPGMVEIKLRLEPDLRTVNADSIQIGQLLMNLALNAKDAMPEGGEILIETANIAVDEEYARLHLEPGPGDYVLLSVSDTGEGMDAETINRIFEPFFTTKQPGKGTGLGLSTVYGIVKQHGGHVTCYSELGQGTTFKVYFPVFGEEKPGEEAAAEGAGPKGGTETVLLVDDDAYIRDLGVKILARAGYTALTAESGQEARDLYRERGENISLVVLDLVMPGMGGKQCMDELLAMDPKAKIIISSGYSVEGRTRKIIETGARDFMSKPFTAVEFLRTIRNLLDAD